MVYRPCDKVIDRTLRRVSSDHRQDAGGHLSGARCCEVPEGAMRAVINAHAAAVLGGSADSLAPRLIGDLRRYAEAARLGELALGLG